MRIPFIESQMLSTLELLHYCRRFEGSLFAFCFERSSHCAEQLTDLRVLLAARIRQVVFCHADPHLALVLENWNTSGDTFSIIHASSQDLTKPELIQQLTSELAAGKAPFVALLDEPQNESERRGYEASAISCAAALGAQKIFMPDEQQGLEINGQFRSYPTIQQVREAITQGAQFNIPVERVQLLIDQQELHKIDIVIVEARRGAIFEEVFTHSGAGTLFTCDYPNILRPATETDMRDIMAMMQPYVVEGSLKPVTEEELLTIIRSFMVYSVNGQIVAAAALLDYGDSCELGKLCTLPRYQARGRARELVRALLKEARARGKLSVFALTIQQHVGEFFERLGFVPVRRESLPDEWKIKYDFSRDSRAFQYNITDKLSE